MLVNNSECRRINYAFPRKYFIFQAWHAVQTIPEGTNGWIPRDPVDSQTGVGTTKRRRLRKRKRRPPIVSYLDQSAENVQPGIYEAREEPSTYKIF